MPARRTAAVVSRGADRQVKVWDWTTGQPVFTWPCDAIRKFGTACTVAFSPDGLRLVSAGRLGSVGHLSGEKVASEIPRTVSLRAPPGCNHSPEAPTGETVTPGSRWGPRSAPGKPTRPLGCGIPVARP